MLSAHEKKNMRKYRSKIALAEIVPVPRYRHYDPQTGILTLGEPQKNISIRQSFEDAFGILGGTRGLAEWASHNPATFFALATKLIPAELTGKDGGPIEVTVIDPTLHLAVPVPVEVPIDTHAPAVNKDETNHEKITPTKRMARKTISSAVVERNGERNDQKVSRSLAEKKRKG